jgi:uncharacterized protein (DUF2062 family)
MMFAAFLERRLVRPIIALLRQGITPEKIAMCLALGVVLGIFPVIGATTFLCALAALFLKLNLPAIQLVNYLVYPLQLALLLPFFRAGEWLFDAEPLPLSIREILRMFDRSAWEAILLLWDTTLHAIIVWCLAAPFIVPSLYLIFKQVLARLHVKTLTD